MADVSPITDVADINIFSKTGLVIDVQLTSETEIHSSSSGGDGWVGPGGGNVSAPTVSIRGTSHERAHIYLRQENGREMEIDIRDSGIGIRTGHRLSAIYAGPKSGDTGHLAALLNHDTGKWMVYDTRIEWLLKRMGPGLVFVILAGLPLSGCVVGNWADRALWQIVGSSGLVPILFVLGCVIAAIMVVLKSKARNDRIKKAIKALVCDEIDRLLQQPRIEIARTA